MADRNSFEHVNREIDLLHAEIAEAKKLTEEALALAKKVFALAKDIVARQQSLQAGTEKQPNKTTIQ